MLHDKCLPLDMTEVAHAAHKSFEQRYSRCFGTRRQLAQPVYFSGLRLRARHKRPRYRPTNPCDEGAPLHSITSSARCWRCKGTSKSSALAVFRLIVSKYFVGA